MAADEDDRDVVARSDQALLELEPAQARQAQIEHNARRPVRHWLAEELLGRGERLDVEVDGPEESLQGATHRVVVVDHEDDGLLQWFVGGNRHATCSF